MFSFLFCKVLTLPPSYMRVLGFEDRLVYRILQMTLFAVTPRTSIQILHHDHALSFHILPQSPFRKHSIVWPLSNERRIDSLPHLLTEAVYQSQSLQPFGVRPGVRPLAFLNCGFESHQVHGCLSLVNVVCCQVEVSATGRSLVQRNPNEYVRVCMFVRARASECDQVQ